MGYPNGKERKIMYMVNYKNTCRRKVPLVRRVTAFVNSMLHSAR